VVNLVGSSSGVYAAFKRLTISLYPRSVFFFVSLNALALRNGKRSSITITTNYKEWRKPGITIINMAASISIKDAQMYYPLRSSFYMLAMEGLWMIFLVGGRGKSRAWWNIIPGLSIWLRKTPYVDMKSQSLTD